MSGLFVAACTSIPRQFPDLNDSELQDVVAVVRFRGGVYLEQFSECQGEDVICLDPPPFELRAEVVQQLFGPSLSHMIVLASTSHYGIPTNDPDELRLVHLITDGASIVMPRYHWERVGEDTDGDLVVPAYPEELWFLPCGTNSTAKPVRFRLPRDRFSSPREDFEEQTLSTNGDFFLISDQVVRPRLGIPIDSLAEFLEERKPSGSADFICDAQ